MTNKLWAPVAPQVPGLILPTELHKVGYATAHSDSRQLASYKMSSQVGDWEFPNFLDTSHFTVSSLCCQSQVLALDTDVQLAFIVSLSFGPSLPR